MRSLRFVVITLSLTVRFAPLYAQTPGKKPPSRVVGSVYGKAVTADQVGLTLPIDNTKKFDARDTPAWEQMERVAVAFGSPVMERLVAQRKLDATADEMAAYRRVNLILKGQMLRETEARLTKVKEELASPHLSDGRKAELEKERETFEQSLPAQRESARRNDDDDDAFGRGLILSWKVERELYRTYGGRLIWQQFGIEALDARRLLFEEAEKKGDLKFDDPGVRRLFYYYSNMPHTFVGEKEPRLLEEKPWFLKDGDEPLPEK